nr:MAG TPA: hypothetical protein [Caudoviricetes sp.]
MRVIFYDGTNRYGKDAKHDSEICVEINTAKGLVRLNLEQGREDICDPIAGYGSDEAYAFVDLNCSELDRLIGMLEVCKSQLQEGYIVPSKTKYRQEGNLQPPEYLKYRYEDVLLDLDSDEVTTDDSPVNVFGSPKRKLLEDTHKDAWEVLGCLKTW